MQFDWTRILKSPSSPAPENANRRSSEGGRDRRPDQVQRPRQAPVPPPAERDVERGEQVEAASEAEAPATTEPGEAAEFPELAEPTELLASEPVEPLERPEPVEPLEALEPLEPIEPLESVEPLESIEPHVPLAARYSRIGAEGLARLRARYAEVMARISERPLEEGAREELRAKAERLNPDGWVTDEDVTSALEQYETVFEELRAVVGRPTRRRRRRRV